jgi:hypothetical protein
MWSAVFGFWGNGANWRFRGVKLASSIDVMPWYANKVDLVRYLEQLNKDKQVIS